LPRIDASLDFLVVQHYSESERQSNTGRLTVGMVSGSEVLPWGWPEVPFPKAELERESNDYLMLYPSVGARALDPDDDRPSEGRRLTLVLLDATWSQTKSMARRVPGVAEIESVVLPPGPPPTWKLRRSPGGDSYCTVEAAIRAIEVIDGIDVARPLRRAMERIMVRSLFMRGKVRQSEIDRVDRASEA